MRFRRLMLALSIAILTGSCSIEIRTPPPATTPQQTQEPQVVVLQVQPGYDTHPPDTVYVQTVETKKRKSRLKRAAIFALKTAVLVGGTYAAVKLGEDNLKWKKSGKGQKVWPFVKKK